MLLEINNEKCYSQLIKYLKLDEDNYVKAYLSNDKKIV